MKRRGTGKKVRRIGKRWGLDETEKEHIELKLRWTRDHADSLSESDLDWAIKMEDAWKRGWLSDKK